MGSNELFVELFSLTNEEIDECAAELLTSHRLHRSSSQPAVPMPPDSLELGAEPETTSEQEAKPNTNGVEHIFVQNDALVKEAGIFVM